jgi:hypothetical protein
MMNGTTDTAKSRLAAFYRSTSTGERTAVYSEVVKQATADQQRIIDKARDTRAARG